MAFNIRDFRSRFEKFGGAARLSLFTVEIYRQTPNRSPIGASDLRFFCKTVTFPGVNLETTENRPYGVGMPVRHPVSMTTQDLNAVFMLDSSHAVLSFFHTWLQDVFNYKASDMSAPNYNDPNQAVYELGYHHDYACNIVIRYYSTHSQDTYYECLLENAYPTQISPIDLSWEAHDQVALAAVSFAFDKMSFTSNKSGPVQSAFSRGFGLLDFITSIGQLGQTINALRKPTDVQDAINMYTSATYSWNNLRGSL